MPFYESQPIIYPLYRLLEEVLSGEIRVPRFQRPGTEFTWQPEQRGDLLDSIYKTFPIGTILLWSSNKEFKTFERVGGATIPAHRKGRPYRLILDGHQRLSTLIAILGTGLTGYKRSSLQDLKQPEALQEQWVFDLTGNDEDDRRQKRFQLLKPGAEPSEKQVPLRIALDRVKLNEWVRKRKTLSSQEIKLVDSLRDRLREYSVPVATLAAESLDIATETFKRINSSGTPMSDFHMVSALAYTNDFDPQAHFDRVRAEFLEPEGWQGVADADVLRVCAGLVRRLSNDTSQHPAKLDIDLLGRSLRNDPQLIEKAGKSVAEAAKLLRSVAGVHGPAVLPYSWQLIVIAIELGSRTDASQLTHPQIEQTRRWFWLTTYGGVFAGVNSAIVNRASQALSAMLAGNDEGAMRRDIADTVEEPARFDFRAARSRACALAMARALDADSLDGHAHRALAASGNDAMPILNPKGRREDWWNLIIAADKELSLLRDALRRQASGSSQLADDEQLRRMSIESSDRGTVEELLQLRRQRLRSQEQAFVDKLGFKWGQVSLVPDKHA